jgi:hypothetical protein
MDALRADFRRKVKTYLQEKSTGASPAITAFAKMTAGAPEACVNALPTKWLSDSNSLPLRAVGRGTLA